MNKTELANCYFKFFKKAIEELDAPFVLEDVKKLALLQAEKDLSSRQKESK